MTKSPPGPALATMERYFAFANEGKYAEMGKLYTEDAVFLAPTGETLHGRERIVEFYSTLLGKVIPHTTITWTVDGGKRCAVEFEGQTAKDRTKRKVVDLVDVDDTGQITRMTVFLRPGGFEALMKQAKG